MVVATRTAGITMEKDGAKAARVWNTNTHTNTHTGEPLRLRAKMETGKGTTAQQGFSFGRIEGMPYLNRFRPKINSCPTLKGQ